MEQRLIKAELDNIFKLILGCFDKQFLLKKLSKTDITYWDKVIRELAKKKGLSLSEDYKVSSEIKHIVKASLSGQYSEVDFEDAFTYVMTYLFFPKAMTKTDTSQANDIITNFLNNVKESDAKYLDEDFTKYIKNAAHAKIKEYFLEKKRNILDKTVSIDNQQQEEFLLGTPKEQDIIKQQDIFDVLDEIIYKSLKEDFVKYLKVNASEDEAKLVHILFSNPALTKDTRDATYQAIAEKVYHLKHPDKSKLEDMSDAQKKEYAKTYFNKVRVVRSTFTKLKDTLKEYAQYRKDVYKDSDLLNVVTKSKLVTKPSEDTKKNEYAYDLSPKDWDNIKSYKDILTKDKYKKLRNVFLAYIKTNEEKIVKDLINFIIVNPKKSLKEMADYFKISEDELKEYFKRDLTIAKNNFVKKQESARSMDTIAIQSLKRIPFFLERDIKDKVSSVVNYLEGLINKLEQS